MSGWKERKRELFIPGKDEVTLKKLECKVCGHKFVPKKENKYLVEDRIITGGIQAAMNGQYANPKRYDAFDCDVCGCQLVVKGRMKQVDDIN